MAIDTLECAAASDLCEQNGMLGAATILRWYRGVPIPNTTIYYVVRVEMYWYEPHFASHLPWRERFLTQASAEKFAARIQDYIRQRELGGDVDEGWLQEFYHGEGFPTRLLGIWEIIEVKMGTGQ